MSARTSRRERSRRKLSLFALASVWPIGEQQNSFGAALDLANVAGNPMTAGARVRIGVELRH